MFWLLGTSFTTLWISLLVLRLPWTFCGRGGGRICIAGVWIQFTRREIERIFASLTTDELDTVRTGGIAAQAVLAAAAARYLASRARQQDDQD